MNGGRPSRRILLLFLPVACIIPAALVLLLDLAPAPLSTPRVVSLSPVDGAVRVVPDSPIIITFTAPMERTATERAVQVVPPINGTFRWENDQTLVLDPSPRLPISTTLNVRVLTGARSWLGRPLASEASARWTTIERPVVTASTPALEAKFAYLPDRVTISFNRRMNRESIERELLVSPPLQNQRVVWGRRSITLFGLFEPRTRYEIRIPPSAVDAQYGIPLERDYVWSFTTGLQYPHLSIIGLERSAVLQAEAPAAISMQLTNVSRVDARLYALTEQDLALEHAPFEEWYVYRPQTRPIRSWSVETGAALDQYVLFDLPIEPLPPGVYYLELSAPEGVRDAQLLRVQNETRPP